MSVHRLELGTTDYSHFGISIDSSHRSHELSKKKSPEIAEMFVLRQRLSLNLGCGYGIIAERQFELPDDSLLTAMLADDRERGDDMEKTAAIFLAKVASYFFNLGRSGRKPFPGPGMWPSIEDQLFHYLHWKQDQTSHALSWLLMRDQNRQEQLVLEQVLLLAKLAAEFGERHPGVETVAVI